MRVAVLVAPLVFAAVALHAFAEDGKSVAGPIDAEVVRVVDGDTLEVRARIWLGQELDTHVRIAGIDAPEMHARCPRERSLAEEARGTLERSLASGHVQLRDVRNDKYGGRVRADVVLDDGRSAAEVMLRSGLVRHYEGGTRQPWCSDSEARR